MNCDSFSPVALDKVFRFFDAGALALLSASFESEEDAMPLQWLTPWRLDAMALMAAPNHRTMELVRKARRFVLAVPGPGIVQTVVTLGLLSGHQDPEKLRHAGARLWHEPRFGLPVLEGSLAWAVFEVADMPEGAATGMTFGRAVAAAAHPGAFRDDRWLDPKEAPPALRPLFYGPGGDWHVEGERVSLEVAGKKHPDA